MSRGDSLLRQLKLIEIIEERKQFSVPEVAEELGYTVRTVYRDLLVLEGLGIPIYQEPDGRRARWRIVEGQQRKKLSVTLSWSEMLGLAAAEKLLTAYEGTLLHDAMRTALDKIRQALPPELRHRAAAGEVVSAELGARRDYANRAASIREIVEAIDRRRRVKFAYRASRAKMALEREVDPYRLHVQGSALYVLGFCHARQGERTFAVDRISDVEQTETTFARPAAFTTRNRLQGMFGPWEGKAESVRLQFEPEVAGLVAEKKVHPTQQTQWRSDGRLDVTMQVPLAPAVVRWLVGFGADVRVLAPKKLAKQVAHEHGRATRS